MKTLLYILLGMFLALALFAGGLAWYMGIHFFDDDEVPIVSVSEGVRPLISFTPADVHSVSVYEGTAETMGLRTIWFASGPGGFENSLSSPVRYGVPPEGSQVRAAAPLEIGKTYTVVVFRRDPKGKGDGFFNTRHRYEGIHTFTCRDSSASHAPGN